ncbi:MAG: urea ABC transporter ATP-binding subunit UrtE [Planctomycetota bacterium]|nr:MAG: urea ABC transporter ATP-binding subunit UrtE [Planctomycetota bacterium]
MLEVKDLHVAYGKVNVIEGVSFTAEKGQTVAIMGRNGMVKTTLMKSMVGVIRSRQGTISLDGVEFQNWDSFKRVREGMAFVPQGRQIFPTLTVEQNIRTGLEANKTTKKIPEFIYELFPVLKEMRKRKGGNLSGGQQQQLAIARALASDPKVLFLDEPTEGIQPSIIKDLARSINTIKERFGLTVVVSEQVLSFTLEIADRIIVIETGEFVRDEARADVDEKTVAKYLSV